MKCVFLIAVAGAVAVAPVLHLAPQTRPQAAPGERILFAVWAPQQGKQPSSPVLDPVGSFEGSALKKLPQEDWQKAEESEDEVDRFNKFYYGPGKQYRLLFGGAELGTASVIEPAGLSCVSLAATVKASAPVPNGQYSLAVTDLAGLGLHDNWRQTPSQEQEAAFAKAAADALTKNGIKSASADGIRIKNLRATKLGENRPTALIGTIAMYKTAETGHNLFLIIEQRDAQWDVVIASYRKTTDTVDRTDDIVENFVDQIDLDGSGTDEIVTIRGYYESWDYAVYKIEKGNWKVAYEGGGGGC